MLERNILARRESSCSDEPSESIRALGENNLPWIGRGLPIVTFIDVYCDDVGRPAWVECHEMERGREAA